MSAITPFEFKATDEQLTDLRRRLAATRWPERETVDDWSQGAPLEKVKALCAYWAERYDWRRCEAVLNRLGQHRTEIDGLGVHFLHIRSAEPDALPLVITHGWPGSVLEFLKVIGPLTDPAAHGGDRRDAFNLVLPSLPGYGFSDKPARTGWGVNHIAHAWNELMKRLGYGRYVAQGGDWGAAVTTALGVLRPPGLAAIHLNMPIAFPDETTAADWTEQERASAAFTQHFLTRESGYSALQGTKPQTLGYGLSDSPAMQAGWIYEKFHGWTDNDGDPASVLTLDEMLDNITLYWLTGTGASSARLYWESMATSFNPPATDVPVGISIFPKELMRPSRRWAARTYRNTVYWNELEKGGHFAAFEQPELFAEELRNCFRQFR
jgi:pimeloyl-ACP methyl ester carboxylesterase